MPPIQQAPSAQAEASIEAAANVQLQQHADAMLRCLKQAFAARAAEHPESAEPPAAPADMAAALAEAVATAAAAEERTRNADAEASRRRDAESETAAALLASDAALQDARAAIATLERERAQLEQRLHAAERRAAELQDRLHAAEAAARAEVPAQDPETGTESGGAQPEVGRAGAPAAAATAATGAGSRPVAKKARKRKDVTPRAKHANAPEPVPEVDPLGPAEPAALPGEDAASDATSAWGERVLKHRFEDRMESIDNTADGSCGFWCWLACFGLCKHAVVRTLQEDKKIKQKLEEAQEKASRAAIRGAPPTKEPTIKGKLEPPVSDYMLLQQLVTHMQQDDDTWDRLRDKACLLYTSPSPRD